MEEDKAAYVEECKSLGIKPNSALLIAMSYEESFIKDRFSLRGNYLGNKGMTPLLPILKDKARLRIIELPRQGLKSSFACKFAEMFAFHPCLQRIDFEGNLIGNKGGAALLSMVQHNENIEQLLLNDNLIYFRILREISRELDSRRRLTTRSQTNFDDWAKTQFTLGESSSIIPFFTVTPDPARSGLTTPAGSSLLPTDRM
jgi:hypothetical protein